MIIIVSDFFAENFMGGAELTTEAILQRTNQSIVRVLSKNLNLELLKKYQNEKWIFGNLTEVETEILQYVASSRLNYHMIEYDYKYCTLRMPAYHKRTSGKCCEQEQSGKIICNFFSNARTLWFMSKGQKEWYQKTFPILKYHPSSHVLSSIFDKETINKITSLDCTHKNNTYLIQQHTNPLKGTEQSIKYAKDNNLEYELFSELSYEQVLEKFAQSRGFIFLPTEFDTCPRVTIEAKMLGCEIITNENTQHYDEEWFNKDNSAIITHMQERLEFFWSTI